MIKTDEYGEVLNSPETYAEIAENLKRASSMLIGWTDEEGSHFDILFTYSGYGVVTEGTIQGGIRGSDLFVSVMRKGAFGFEFNNTDKDWIYIDEKLTGRFGRTTGEKLAELINGVMHAINPTQPESREI